jgi:hypothetical protein
VPKQTHHSYCTVFIISERSPFIIIIIIVIIITPSFLCFDAAKFVFFWGGRRPTPSRLSLSLSLFRCGIIRGVFLFPSSYTFPSLVRCGIIRIFFFFFVVLLCPTNIHELTKNLILPLTYIPCYVS